MQKNIALHDIRKNNDIICQSINKQTFLQIIKFSNIIFFSDDEIMVMRFGVAPVLNDFKSFRESGHFAVNKVVSRQIVQFVQITGE